MTNKFLKIAKQWMPVAVMAFVFVYSFSVGAVAYAQVGINPPAKILNQQGIVSLIGEVARFIITIGIAIAVIVIVVGGLKYMFAGGETESAGKARTLLYNGLIGLVIMIAAYVIVFTVSSLVTTWLQ